LEEIGGWESEGTASLEVRVDVLHDDEGSLSLLDVLHDSGSDLVDQVAEDDSALEALMEVSTCSAANK